MKKKILLFFILLSLIFIPLTSSEIVEMEIDVSSITSINSFSAISTESIPLSGDILSVGDVSTMTSYVSTDKKIHISDTVHGVREVKLNYKMLQSELANFDGKTIGLTHINDDGIVDSRRIVSVSPGAYGYVTVLMEFSTTIVSGFTGYTQYSTNNVSGNNTLLFNDYINATFIDFEITNHGSFYGKSDSGGNYSYFTNKTNVTISTNGTSTPINYPVKITIPYMSEMQVDFSDVRFNTQAGDYIDYWIESYTASTTADIWVELPDAIVDPGNVTISHLYGNSTLTSESNGTDTFSIFVDSSEGLDSWSSNGVTVVGDTLQIASGVGNYLTSNNAVSYPTVLTVNASFAAAPAVFGFGNDSGVISLDAENEICWYLADAGSFYPYWGDPTGAVGTTAGASTAYNIWVIEWTGDAATSSFYKNNVQYASPGSGDYPANASMHVVIGGKSVTDSSQINIGYLYSRKYILNEPTATIGDIQTPTSTNYVTVIITGDTDNSTYNSSETKSFTLTPTLTINEIQFYSNSTDYSYTATLFWKQDLHVYSLDNTINFSLPYNPALDLYSPTDGLSISYVYPPYNHDVDLKWENTTGNYEYFVTDYDTGATISSGSVLTNYTTVSLPANQYKWYVKSYDDVFDEWSATSEIWDFEIENTYAYNNTTGVQGVVYEYIADTTVPVDATIVNIWNDTWSDTQVTGTNGYYVFLNLSNDTYYLKATKDRYIESSTERVTLVTNNMTTMNILIQKDTGQYYSRHDVTFTVKSLFGTVYPDVEVNAYIDSSDLLVYTDTTDSTGSVVFTAMDEGTKYRITFIDESSDIDIEITIYPVDTSYTVYVGLGTIIDDLLDPDDTDQEITAVETSITKTIVDDDNANITVNYNDVMSETSNLTFTLMQSIAGDSDNRTILSTYAFGAGNHSVSYNFTVIGYEGQSYFVLIESEHTTFGDIYRLFGVQFEDTSGLFGFAVKTIGFIGMIFIVWFALTSTSSAVPQTAVGLCAIATTFKMLSGWGYYISDGGLALAWIISIAAVFASSKEAPA